jgi:predicted lactoylglutathione lyase
VISTPSSRVHTVGTLHAVRPAATRARTSEPSTAAGGSPDPNPAQDFGSMFSRSVEDPDGYVWEILWMDVAAHAQALEPA